MGNNYTKDSFKIALEYDHWSGFIVVALTRQSETIVVEIAKFLEKLLQDTCN